MLFQFYLLIKGFFFCGHAAISCDLWFLLQHLFLFCTCMRVLVGGEEQIT